MSTTTTAAGGGGGGEGHGVKMHLGYAKALGRIAYVWGWPMVNMLNRRASLTRVPYLCKIGGLLPAAPRGRLVMNNDYLPPGQTFVTCPNQDVIYGIGCFDLDVEPVVVQVPDFGDRFWVLALYDQRSDECSSLGKPYGTAPGFYLLVGPNWSGGTPAGITGLVQSSTSLAIMVPRVFMDDTAEDRAAVQINQLAGYPLTEFDGSIKTVDWAQLPTVPAPPVKGDGREMQWVVPERFFEEQQFGAVLKQVAALPGEEALVAQFRALMTHAAKDEAVKQALVETAVQAEEEVISPLFSNEYHAEPAGNGWMKSPSNTAAFGTDYLLRAGVAKASMLANKTEETQYFNTEHDSEGGRLHGAKSYDVIFPPGSDPPVHGFWSLTLYNDKHFFHPNPLGHYSLGTKSLATLKRDPEDGSLTIHVGRVSPGKERESNWLPSPPGEPFALYLRAYWPKQPDMAAWTPPRVVPTGV